MIVSYPIYRRLCRVDMRHEFCFRIWKEKRRWFRTLGRKSNQIGKHLAHLCTMDDGVNEAVFE